MDTWTHGHRDTWTLSTTAARAAAGEDEEDDTDLRTRTRGRKLRGGSVANAGSAWNSIFETVGTGDQQWNNVFVKGGPFGNQLQNLDGTQPSVVPNSPPATPMKGGRRTRRRGTKSKKGRSRKNRSRRGGFLGNVVNQAIVPFGLLAAQQYYGKRVKKNRK